MAMDDAFAIAPRTRQKIRLLPGCVFASVLSWGTWVMAGAPVAVKSALARLPLATSERTALSQIKTRKGRVS